jgi:hypothetical protein
VFGRRSRVSDAGTVFVRKCNQSLGFSGWHGRLLGTLNKVPASISLVVVVVE